MKRLLQFSLVFLCLILFSNGLYSQDIIHKKNGKVLESKVIEIGADEIRYRLHSDTEGPLYAVDKMDVTKIEFENGRTEYYADNFSNPELYKHQNRQAIKIGFLSPLAGHTSFTYEKNVSPGRGFELKGSIIGLGIRNENRKSAGAFFSAGYKFYRTPDYYMKGMRYAHILKGGYIKPEIILGSYSETVRELFGGDEVKRNNTFGAIMVNFGKQWVYSDRIAIDVYAGVGYGFDNTLNDDFLIDIRNHYAITKFGEGTNFAGALGFNLGFLF